MNVSGSGIDHTAACLLYPEHRTREDAVSYHRALGESEDGGGRGRNRGGESR